MSADNAGARATSWRRAAARRGGAAVVNGAEAYLWSFLGTGFGLLAWSALLLTGANSRGRALTVDVVLRNQHYLQACAQLCIFVYWGNQTVPKRTATLPFAFVQTGRLQEAVAPLQRALELQPDYSEAHLGLAHAFSAVGQPHAAVEQFREALRLQSAAEPLSRRPATILSWGGEERRRIGGPIDGPPTGGYSLERELRAEFDDPSVQERDRPQIG